VRNQAEALAYQTEKFLTDNADKVPDDVKTEVEAAIAEVKTTLESEDTAAIKSAAERLSSASQKVGQSMYAADAAAGGTGAGEAGEATGGPDDVVDAEIVEEDAPPGEGAA
jgi:molecular chaperone DnaK